MATSVVFPRVQFFANNGRPLIGGRIHTYVAGSSTRARTYKDAAKAQPNANPIILDARGEASVYLAEGVEYKFVIEDSQGALIMTQEPVYGAVWPNAAEWPSDATLSYQYMTEAKAAAGAIGPVKFYDTKAQAAGDLANLQDGDLIEVSADETADGARTRYKVQGGALVFVVNLEQLRIDITRPAGHVPAGGFDSYARLRAYTGQATKITINGPVGATAPSGIYGDFVRDDSDTTTADDGGTVIVDTTGRRWKRIITGPSDIRWFGALLNGTFNDGPALVANLAYLSRLGGGTVRIPDGGVLTIASSTDITVPENCAIQGTHHVEVKELDVSTMSSYTPRIKLPQTSRIILSSSAGLANLLIVPPNVRYNVSSTERAAFFKGTAVVIADQTSGQYIDNVGAFGYEYGIASPGNAASIKRVYIKRFLHDCKNGVYLRNSYDLSICTEVWARPFCSFNATGEPNNNHLRRDGFNICYDSVSAYSIIDNAFDFGWNRGISIIGDGNGAVTLMNPGSDHPGGVNDGSRGIDIANSTYEVNIVNPRISGKAQGIHINTVDPNGRISINGGSIYESVESAVVNERGKMIIDGGLLLRNAGSQGTPVGNGIYAMNTSASTVIGNVNVEGFAIGVKTDSDGARVYIDATASIERCTVRANNPFIPGVLAANIVQVSGDPIYRVAGNADISNIARPDLYIGKPLSLRFMSDLTIKTGGNINIAEAIIVRNGEMRVFFSDGVKYFIQ